VFQAVFLVGVPETWDLRIFKGEERLRGTIARNDCCFCYSIAKNVEIEADFTVLK
jgi:hypothetical protein